MATGNGETLQDFLPNKDLVSREKEFDRVQFWDFIPDDRKVPALNLFHLKKKIDNREEFLKEIRWEYCTQRKRVEDEKNTVSWEKRQNTGKGHIPDAQTQ